MARDTSSGSKPASTANRKCPAGTSAGKPESALHRLYTGTGAFDIVGKRKWCYLAFGTAIVICLLSIVLRGFNFGIEFKGGTQIQLPASGTHGVIAVDDVKRVYSSTLGKDADSVYSVGSGASATIQIRTETLNANETGKVEDALFNQLQPKASNGKPSRSVISDTAVGASWGGQISRQALIGLIVFLVLVSIFIALYFERWMAVAGLVALINDVTVAAGVYSLVGFEVNPPTVIGLLTILGFSLYDTVVVFDKVKENTRGLLGLTRRTYAEAANLALNQTLMRSINTSLTALLPVVGLLIVGVGILGVGTLTDLALVQMVGLLSGALSSIFLATPLLVDLKMREKPYQEQARRVLARRRTVAQRRAAERGGADAGTVDDGADADGGAGDVVESFDDDTIDAEVRKEKALTAAASVPARTAKKSEAKRSGAARSTAKSTAKSMVQSSGAQSSGAQSGKPSGKPRPTGKKRR